MLHLCLLFRYSPLFSLVITVNLSSLLLLIYIFTLMCVESEQPSYIFYYICDLFYQFLSGFFFACLLHTYILYIINTLQIFQIQFFSVAQFPIYVNYTLDIWLPPQHQHKVFFILTYIRSIVVHIWQNLPNVQRFNLFQIPLFIFAVYVSTKNLINEINVHIWLSLFN